MITIDYVVFLIGGKEVQKKYNFFKIVGIQLEDHLKCKFCQTISNGSSGTLVEFENAFYCTDALTKPKLRIFTYSNDNKEWSSEDETILKFDEVISARIYA